MADEPKQRNPAAPQKLAIAERRRIACELRKQGGSYRVIATQMKQMPGISPNYSEAQAHRDVTAELQRITAETAEIVEDMRRLELERIDELFALLYARAKKGDYAALDRVLTLMDKRGRYIPGLFAPQQLEHMGPDGGPAMALLTVDDWKSMADKRRTEAEKTMALYEEEPSATG